ncbi:unnamed protein product [Phytophthora fragariaefolia]|uniref:Unnamed protein product n=1 Tax=Phytophthora fragariaefolia TaxID=1490495 RepID=A0A9W7CSU9_9STRA|nr:unnamed protein product [Phytophthora fragariaefolia]
MYRLEVYCEKNEQQASSGPTPADDNAGPADDNAGPAVTLRNRNAVLPPKQDGVYYAVVTDRFYTSIQNALQLLELCEQRVLGWYHPDQQEGLSPGARPREVETSEEHPARNYQDRSRNVGPSDERNGLV